MNGIWHCVSSRCTRQWFNVCIYSKMITKMSFVNLPQVVIAFSFFFFFNFTLFYFIILYWFCHTSTWIHHGCTWVPNPEPLSHLLPHTISLGHSRAPAPNILYPASNLDVISWQLSNIQFILLTIVTMLYIIPFKLIYLTTGNF